MASYRAGQKGPERITFKEGRAAWRDLPALVPGPSDENDYRRPAATINYAASLHDELGASSADYQPLLVAGVAGTPKKLAKLLRWRMEQIALPANLLADPDRAQLLKDMVGDADTVFGALRWLVQQMVSESLPDPSHADTRAKAKGLVAAGPLSSIYFAVAERALPELMYQLGAGDFDAAEVHWAATLRRAVFDAWSSVVAGLGGTPRGLRAEARFFPRLFGLLNEHGLKTKEANNPSQAGVVS
jgi:CRISPR system Cascade subunit CasA